MKRYKNFVTEAGRCWPGHKPVPGKKPFSPGSCMKEEVIAEGRPSQRHPLEGHDYHKKTDAELTYIAKDAHKAAEAMKSHNTTAENKYRDQANDSATVRYWRQKNGMPDWYKKKYGHIKEEVEQVQEIAPVIAGVARAVGPAIARTTASAVGNVAKKVVAGGARVVGSAIASTTASSLAKKDDSEDGDDGKFSSGPAKPATKNPKLVSPKNESAAWQRKEGKNPEGGLNRKGIASYRAENPGSKLSMAVTTPPSKLKPGSKAANRRKSFCARMGGMEGPMKKPNGEPSRKALALRKWNC